MNRPAAIPRGRPGERVAPAGAVRRPLAFLLHSLFGLKLSLLLGFVCLTGTIATVSHEIEWVIQPEVRGVSDGRTDDYAAMWGLVRDRYPDAYIQSIGTYDRADTGYFARQADIVLADGTARRLYIDPSRMVVTGEGSGPSFHFVMRALHYYLLLPTDWPFYLVTSLGFVLILSLVTGLLTYKKFWRGFFRLPRWNRSTRTWSGDLHRLIGLWSLWFVAVIGLTSIWYFVERAAPSLETAEPEARSRHVLPTPAPARVSAWITAARSRFPGISITLVQMPYGESDPVVVQGQWRAWLVRERTNALFIDPATDQVVGARVAGELAAAERWVHTADPLHFGNFGGLVTKLIWMLFGLLLTALCATGVIIFTKRVAHAAQALR
ncbi:PepSY-associated TM helix domain-containing protein [Allosphingosinicella deserti]|uniref:Peptidase n=1 Tax=Allosphingosinicella deserti TaxID=2116704 RepID=A0A2P7QE53_9SPHN|nr:PepSY-associated TM helix domain-containing protein [Sphingomonas deserti]PSJ36257.1 peptidase [Sphingomonas deserti]